MFQSAPLPNYHNLDVSRLLRVMSLQYQYRYLNGGLTNVEALWTMTDCGLHGHCHEVRSYVLHHDAKGIQ